MSKMLQRIAALVVMVAVTMGATVWGVSSTTIHYKNIQSDAPVVMTINGDEVHADEYAGMLYNYMLYYEQMYSSFGLTDIWNNEELGPAMLQTVQADAYNQIVSTHVVLQHFNDLGMSLSYAEQKALQQQLSDTIESVGGMEMYTQLLADMGFTPDTYSNMSYSSACYRALDEYYYGENGVNLPTDEELIKQFEETYPDALAAEHILISLTDPTTGETRTEDQAKAEAQKVLDRLNAGENFEDVMNEARIRVWPAIRTATCLRRARCCSRSTKQRLRCRRVRFPAWCRRKQDSTLSNASRSIIRLCSKATAAR